MVDLLLCHDDRGLLLGVVGHGGHGATATHVLAPTATTRQAWRAEGRRGDTSPWGGLHAERLFPTKMDPWVSYMHCLTVMHDRPLYTSGCDQVLMRRTSVLTPSPVMGGSCASSGLKSPLSWAGQSRSAVKVRPGQP